MSTLSVGTPTAAASNKRQIRLARQAVEAARVVSALGGAALDENQRQMLQAFPGWGPAARLFDEQPGKTWAALADDLDEAAGDAAQAAARVVDTSFFTPPELIARIYGLLQAAGFAGGSVLDLGCGSGRFFTHAPADLDITMTGVEADPISAQIAAALHPTATILTGELQSVTLPPQRFDAALGNVPFSAAKVYDGSIGFYGALHEYFLVRAVRAVRPGGYVVMVTSRHTLDARSGLSTAITEHADLIAAVRLPSGYFRGEGTDVVADVVALRVRESYDAALTGRADQTTQVEATVSGRHCRETLNRFWVEHPGCVSGEMRLTGFDRNGLAVDADKPSAAVAAAFTAAQALMVPYKPENLLPADLADVQITDAEGRKEGSFHEIDGAVMRVTDGALVAVSRPGAELRALIALRDAALALVDAESDWTQPDSFVEPLRVACRDLYEAYVNRYGSLNRGASTVGKPDPETGEPRLGWRTAPLGGFRRDPDSAIVLALEVYEQGSGESQPAAILARRVNKRPTPAQRADTPGEALSICLGEGRGLDLARIAELLELDGDAEAFDALGDLVYREPGTGQPVIARDYLAGDVRAKLREALAAASVDPSYKRNVSALEPIQPQWLGRDEIRIELGSPWVSPGDVADFCAEVFGHRAQVSHIPVLAAWEVNGYSHQLSAEARIAYCTGRLNAFELLAAGLNGAAPIIYDEIYDSIAQQWRRVRNAEQTEAAEQALAAIAERFSIWVWENHDREQRIAEAYNQTMNAHVLRRHDGAHLTFPALADGLELWSWQRDFVDQAVSTPATFAAHEVGLGKTLTSIALAMTLRQFGLANKVGYIVPNHLIEQATRQAYQAWPAGRFLIVTRDDLHGANRRRFAARCATGDWDLVIMTHETFSSLPVPASVERAWLNDQLAEFEHYTRASGHTAKRVAAAVRSLQGRIERLRDTVNDPDTVTFPMVGLDYLIVDEADRFRRLPIATRADGFSLGSSKRATDLMLKVSMLRRANPDRPHATFLTGTPFTNTLAEAYVWTRVLAPEQLSRTGLGHFDAWAAQFIRYEVIVEVAPDGGGFRSRRRPAVIQNVPELRTMLAEFMSMLRAEDTGLSRPTPVRHSVLVQPTEATRDFMATLVQRADNLRARRVTANEDNMLLICGDGRKVALDPNLVGIRDEAPKLASVAATVAQIYHQSRENAYPGHATPGAFQLVLCDLGTPRPGDSQSYGRIRDSLIAQGVPAGHIRFIHEATTPKAREALFAGCRDGSIPILLGSTPKVGIGTNIQDRLIALHHVDPTWTASAWEQRNGRGIRNGNHHSEVAVYCYVAESTFDAFMFGVIERKARGFEQLYRTDSQAREIEDLNDATLSFGELKAAASGNTLLLRQHELATTVRRLRLAHITAQQNVRALRSSAAHAVTTAGNLLRRADDLNELSPHRGALTRAAIAGIASQAFDSYRRDLALSGGVRIGFTSTDPGYSLRLTHRYTPIWSESLPPKVRRRGVDAVQTWAAETITGWMAGLDDEIHRAKTRAAELQQSAADAETAASAVDTAESAELTATRAELDAVNQQISDELASDTSPKAA